jgi:hypothetical protein
MKDHRTRLAAVAVVAASALIAAPAAGAKKAAPKAEPDLVVTRVIIEGRGRNPYLIIEPSGDVTPFSVSVTTRNIGHAEAPPSETRLRLIRGTGAQFGAVTIPVHRLAPGQSQTVTAGPKDDVPFKLGTFHIRTIADNTGKVTESHEGNNVRTSGDVPVIARQWDVHMFRSDIESQAVYTDIDTTDAGFQFKFARLDVPSGLFYYAPYGSASTSDLYDPQGCFGIGEAHASHSPWPVGSFLSLNFTLTKYLATIQTSAEPPDVVTFTCGDEGGGSIPQHWVNMQTNSGSGGPQSMSATKTELDGSGQQGAFVTFKWSWDFTADVPK